VAAANAATAKINAFMVMMVGGGGAAGLGAAPAGRVASHH
jgi:hypothetical protein